MREGHCGEEWRCGGREGEARGKVDGGKASKKRRDRERRSRERGVVNVKM